MKTDVLRPFEVTWEDWVLGGGPMAGFEDPALPLEVEIGPGEDAFLLESALAQPDRNWLGIEYSRKRVRRYVRRIERRAGALGNLRLIWRPAVDLVRPFLTPERVHAYHVYFPDPWPKKHHHRFRLFTPTFIRDLEASLVPGGEVHVSSDELAYVLEILEAFRAVPGLESLSPDAGPRVASRQGKETVFERRWRALGREIYLLDYRKAGLHAE
ncbi:MAG: tRNA (guanine(46)-N(7))-methyltransferase TrmB [Planctomycetota bacterium]|jgi:tRNA (guanine-N7-)-methyltransferase